MKCAGPGEPVTVGAVFPGGSRMKPAWLFFGGRKIRIEETHFSWTERRGVSTLYHFSVSSGGDTYHLVFSSGDLSWRLEQVELTT